MRLHEQRSAAAGGPRPTFSVLVATYNHEAYLPEALESVEAQSFTDYELVIVDDGSTDRTPELLAAWQAEFARRRPNRVVIARTENGGQSRAYEHGLRFCEGEYVCLLDSDDRWAPRKLEAVRAAVAEHPEVGMVCHPVLVVGPDGRPTGRMRPSRARLSRGDLRAQVRRTGRTVAAVTSGLTVRSDVLRSLLPMPTTRFRFGADGYITTGASLRAPVEVIPEPLAFYRIHPTGQYVTRMLSEDGPRLAMDIHRAVASHFGLEDSLKRSSYFTRHEFAEAKLHGGAAQQLRAFARLLRATASDDDFDPATRLVLGALWTVGALAPRSLFIRLWRWFQLRHTGLDLALGARAVGRHAMPPAPATTGR
jgi:glycosyltransferase involved in cell wall biosynthesis